MSFVEICLYSELSWGVSTRDPIFREVRDEFREPLHSKLFSTIIIQIILQPGLWVISNALAQC